MALPNTRRRSRGFIYLGLTGSMWMAVGVVLLSLAMIWFQRAELREQETESKKTEDQLKKQMDERFDILVRQERQRFEQFAREHQLDHDRLDALEELRGRGPRRRSPLLDDAVHRGAEPDVSREKR